MRLASEGWINELFSMKERMDALYQDTVQAVQPDTDMAEAMPVWEPVADVFENEEKWTAVVDLPGVSKADFSLELVQDTLVLSGTRPEGMDKSYETILRERPSGPFKRQWSLPENIEQEKVSADYRDGVLTIVVPKTPVASRKVPVRAET
ncbi:MAG: Hsp20/alpha crystallin family protein [Desulfosoma sp.]